MKSCRICGTENEDTNKFCPECGASFELPPFVYEEETVSSGYVPPPMERHYPMKWHKFLMIVWFYGGFLGIVRGLLIVSGIIYHLYGMDPVIVYKFHPKLEYVDLIYGIVSVALSTYQIIMANRLHLFCKNGPLLMIIFLILSITSSFFYLIASNAAIGRISITIVHDFLLTAALIPYMIINIIYYQKRQDLFVN